AAGLTLAHRDPNPSELDATTGTKDAALRVSERTSFRWAAVNERGSCETLNHFFSIDRRMLGRERRARGDRLRVPWGPWAALQWSATPGGTSTAAPAGT